VVTIASATFVVNADDTTADFRISERIITGVVVPPASRNPAGTDPNTDARAVLEVDTAVDPLNPTFHPWWCIANGVWQRYQWNGVNAVMTVMGSGGGREISMFHNPSGGGEYHYNGSTTINPAYHVEEAAEPVELNLASRIFLKGWIIDETGGVPTPTDETVGLYYGVDDESTCTNLCTITNVQLVSGPGNVASIIGNKIVGMTFDNVSIYSVDWQAVSVDLLVDGQQHIMMPRAEV
jgi:hypothetical protein